MRQIDEAGDAQTLRRQERREFHSYVWGIGLAVLLTLVPFALVYWAGVSRLALLVVIGTFAVLQIVIHFRFFLHIGFRQKREDLQLLLFSALLLLIMVTGTLWIMASLARRMNPPLREFSETRAQQNPQAANLGSAVDKSVRLTRVDAIFPATVTASSV